MKTRRLIQPSVAIALVALLLGVPFWLVIATAGKGQGGALDPNLTPPSQWQLFQNFSDVIQQGRMVPGLLGSLSIMVISVAGVLVLGSIGSLGSRTTQRQSYGIHLCVGHQRHRPPSRRRHDRAAATATGFGRNAGRNDRRLHGYVSLPVIFFVTGFVRTIPVELEEAARVDGAGPLKVFVRIILPLLGPTLATATILICLYVWNDVFYALFVGGRLDMLPLNLYQVASSGLHLQNWHLIFAYIILMSLPLLITFVVMQRKIIAGITNGAVK